MQYIHAGSFHYLNLARNMLISLANVKARVASFHTGITLIQVDINKVFNYLNALSTLIVIPILIAPSYSRQLHSDVKEG